MLDPTSRSHDLGPRATLPSPRACSSRSSSRPACRGPRSCSVGSCSGSIRPRISQIKSTLCLAFALGAPLTLARRPWLATVPMALPTKATAVLRTPGRHRLGLASPARPGGSSPPHHPHGALDGNRVRLERAATPCEPTHERHPRRPSTPTRSLRRSSVGTRPWRRGLAACRRSTSRVPRSTGTIPSSGAPTAPRLPAVPGTPAGDRLQIGDLGPTTRVPESSTSCIG